MASTTTTLSVAVAHAIAFLTRPLIVSYPATTVIRLQVILEANLTTLFASNWVPKEPLRGSGRRCLTLSPSCLPPRPIYAACIAAGVQWFDWMSLLGGREFDLLIDPGCVSIRLGKKGTPTYQVVPIWADEVPIPSAPKTQAAHVHDEAQIQAQIQAQAAARSKTLAQQLLEEDAEEDDQLFAILADELSAPIAPTPTIAQFPVPSRSDSPLSVLSAHSRSSSRSSNSSSGFSFVSGNTSLTSISTTSTPSKLNTEKPVPTDRKSVV